MVILSFIKVQAASIAGSVIDYLITIILVSWLHCWYLAASISGNIFGASVLFALCRKWIFRAYRGNVRWQIIRFILVFAGNMILASIGIYMLTQYVQIQYIISKTIMSVLLGISYNYIMQKKFVFA